MAEARKPIRLLAIAGLVAAVAIAVTVVFGVGASAQTSKAIGSGGHVLHQDVLPPKGTKALSSGAPAVFGDKPGEGQNPSAVAAGSKILPEPSKDATRGVKEPVHGTNDIGADRDTQARPDYNTKKDGTLQYKTIFNPSVIPFKRMSSVDRVRRDYTMYATSHARATLRIGGKRTAGRDLFWGSLVLRFKTGKDIPIPSVAPDMRILSYEVSPNLKAPLTFSKDASDNYFVRTDESGIAGTYRIVFLADADARHFSGEVPVGYTVRDVKRKGRSLLHTPPANVQSVANRALRKLGVYANMDLKKALNTLVRYFRSYEAKDKPPPSTGDIYWDLFTSKAGVCRHRSFVFMVTANALGIPTRYVTNEAHAWVEVWVPETKWIRIDLGGAAMRMEVSNAKDKTIYRPRQKDSFPKPDKYANNYTRLRGDIKGLSTEQIKEAQDDTVDPKTPPDWDINDPDEGPGPDPDALQIGPGKSLPSLPDKATRNKTSTWISVDNAVAPVAYRGESIKVRGRLVDNAGDGVDNQVINIWLAPSGQGGDDAVLVGTGVSDKDGKFSVDVELAKDLTLRTYEVFASTAGDQKFAPSVSQ